MIPNAEELEKIRAEFSALPNVLGAVIEIVPASVRVRTLIETLSFGEARPIYHKEVELAERFPDLRLDVRVEVADDIPTEIAEERPAGKSEGEARADTAFMMGLAWLLQSESKQSLADRLMVSIPTIDRWMRGVNLPHRLVQKSMFQAMKREKCSDCGVILPCRSVEHRDVLIHEKQSQRETDADWPWFSMHRIHGSVRQALRITTVEPCRLQSSRNFGGLVGNCRS